MKTLVSALKVSVCAEHERRLAIIDSEDYLPTMRKTKEHLNQAGHEKVTDHYLEQGVWSLKQYYAIALLDPANGHAISAAIDPFWHAHILHSRQYAKFCDAVVGDFMHHIPLDKGNDVQMANIRTLYHYTLEVLGKLFVPSATDTNFWPMEVTDAHLICWHFGNTRSYPQVQDLRLLEPDPRGANHAFQV